MISGEERNRARGQARENLGNLLERVHAYGFQVRTEHRLDRSFPASIDSELLREPRVRIHAARLEPVDDLALALPERCALQRVERYELTLGLAQTPERGLDRLGGLALVGTHFVQLARELGDTPARGVTLALGG